MIIPDMITSASQVPTFECEPERYRKKGNKWKGITKRTRIISGRQYTDYIVSIRTDGVLNRKSFKKRKDAKQWLKTAQGTRE